MKKFAFRLETLLRYRKNLEEKEQAELFQLFSRHQRENGHLQDLQRKHQEVLAELTEQKSAGADYGETSWFYLYLDRLRFEMRRSAERIYRLEQDIQEQKAVLIEASKKKKILDSLKTKEKKAYVSAADKQEQKAIDDLVIIRFPYKNECTAIPLTEPLCAFQNSPRSCYPPRKQSWSIQATTRPAEDTPIFRR